ncbi:hypothetical protein BH23ACT2_BH23ACT2_24230 [soil metagenome]
MDPISFPRDEALNVLAALADAITLAEEAGRFAAVVQWGELHDELALRIWPDLPEA